MNIFGKGFVGILTDRKPLHTHKKEAARAYNFAKKQVRSGKHDIVILDEIISAVEEKVLSLKKVLDLIKSKSVDAHLCLTGHKKYQELIKVADLVTEMKMIKHPYYKGILAQRGIDY